MRRDLRGRALFAVSILWFAAGAAAAGCPPPTEPTAAEADLEITYFGVSTVLFSAGQDQLLIDGFFTRPKTRPMLLNRLGPATDLIAQRLDGAKLGQLHAVLVAHAHHDHGMDAGEVARQAERRGQAPPRGALVVGTSSAVNVAQAGGLDASRTCVAADGDSLTFGPFTVEVLAAKHGPSFWLLRWMLHGDTPASLRLPARFYKFKDRENLSYRIRYGDRSVLVYPSSGLPKRPVTATETVLLGIGGLGVERDYIPDYWRAVAKAATPQTVIPIHWDRFTEPLGETWVPNPLPLDKVKVTTDWLAARPDDGIAVCFLQPFGKLRLPASGALPPLAADASRGAVESWRTCDGTRDLVPPKPPRRR